MTHGFFKSSNCDRFRYSLHTGQEGEGTLESRMMVSIEQIFDLQERCLQHALPMIMEQFTFVKECLEVVINRHVHEEVINELDDEDRERIRGVHT